MRKQIFVWNLKVWTASRVKIFFPPNILKLRSVLVATVAATFFGVMVLYVVPLDRVTSIPISAVIPEISNLVAFFLECHGFFLWVVV